MGSNFWDILALKSIEVAEDRERFQKTNFKQIKSSKHQLQITQRRLALKKRGPSNIAQKKLAYLVRIVYVPFLCVKEGGACYGKVVRRIPILALASRLY